MMRHPGSSGESRRYAVVLLAALAGAIAFVPRVQLAAADDVADEADLQFELGAARYKANDFLGALEHFLASNRLAPNRNVVFNIARCYEQLARFPDAFRAYTQALDGETKASTKKTIEEAIGRISPKVAVVDVQSDPPGATIYLDRKDLGARGAAPRLLGLAPGKYTILVELPGYELAQSQEITVKEGTSTKVSLKLSPILGTVDVAGATVTGAEVHLDDEKAKTSCIAPCTVTMPPGHHTLFLAREGYALTEVPVDLAPKGKLEVRPKMTVLTGGVVVNADLRDALIEIDEQPFGFTPAVLQVPVGKHKLRISLSGYRTVEQEVTVTGAGQAKVDVQLTEASEVTAASRITERVEDAPASVSIVPKHELVGMGYPTIAEALRGVKGIYVSDDRSYVSLGFRGFGRPGDYGNRVLVLVDGVSTNDNYIGSSYVGFDARVDLEDVERIEVVRGPGSALYGTSAFFGVINLVTRARTAPTHVEAGTSIAEYGVARARVHATYRISEDAGFWISLSGARSQAGRDFAFSELSTADNPGGVVNGLDGFNAGTLSGRAWWKSLTLSWFVNQHKKHVPNGSFETTFPDPNFTFLDKRTFVELKLEPKLGAVDSFTRAHLNLYDFDGVLPFAFDRDKAGLLIGGTERDTFRGRWVGVEQRFAYSILPTLRATVGGEVQFHLQTHQLGTYDSAPGTPYLDRDDPYRIDAGYAVLDWTPSNRVKIEPAARIDHYSTAGVGTSINPRFAFLFHPADATTLKVLAGKAFRAPSVYELYYAAGDQDAALTLKPETIYSGEIELTQRFSTTVAASLSGYANYVKDLIRLDDKGDAGKIAYTNSDRAVLTTGAEVEMRRDFRQGWMIAGQVSLQRTRYLDNGDSKYREVPNSPNTLAGIKGAVPIISRALTLYTRLAISGPRWDKFDKAADVPQQKLEGAFIWDMVLGGEAERPGVRWNVGIYNLFDWRWSAPVSREFTQRSVVQNGRTLFASLSISI